MKRIVSAVVVVVLLLGRGSPASAQEVTSGTVDAADLWRLIRHKPVETETQRSYRDPMKVWAPVIGAKPSAGVMIGVAGNVAFFRGEPQTTHISSVVASLTFSSKHQTALSGRFTMFTRGDQWRAEGDNRAQWTSQDTYGLGTAAEASAGVNARFDFFRIHETAYRRVGPGVFAGLGLHFDDHSNIRPGTDITEDQWSAAAFVDYSTAHSLPLDRQISAGLSANLIVDTRDSAIDPRSGSLAASGYRGLIKDFLGGSSGWQVLHLEGRTYRSLTRDSRRRLAFWTFGDFVVDGTAPFFDLPATGMDTYGRSGRGYSEGRFRGEALMYGEVEYRAALTNNGLLGMVVFLNATTVANRQSDERLFESAALGAGAGVRLLVNKHSRTSLCFDVGAGKEGSYGVYLAVQEAF